MISLNIIVISELLKQGIFFISIDNGIVFLLLHGHRMNIIKKTSHLKQMTGLSTESQFDYLFAYTSGRFAGQIGWLICFIHFKSINVSCSNTQV